MVLLSPLCLAAVLELDEAVFPVLLAELLPVGQAPDVVLADSTEAPEPGKGTTPLAQADINLSLLEHPGRATPSYPGFP